MALPRSRAQFRLIRATYEVTKTPYDRIRQICITNGPSDQLQTQARDRKTAKATLAPKGGALAQGAAYLLRLA